MTDTYRELLIIGLRNAHAMENQAQELLEQQIRHAGDYPAVKRRLEEHLTETLVQKRRLEHALHQMDSSPSMLKVMLLSLGVNLAAIGHAVAGDEILKNTFANHALENYEIAVYRSLLAMCDEAGVRGFVDDLRASLMEEERMAKWISENVENVTRQYMDHERSEAA